MAKTTKAKSIEWTKGLNEMAVREAFDDATVDCHDEDEQFSGLLTMVEQELAFPFPAKLLGEVVTVVDMEWPESDEFGLDLIVERNGERHRVDVRSFDLLPPLPAGHLYLAAYLYWKRRL